MPCALRSSKGSTGASIANCASCKRRLRASRPVNSVDIVTRAELVGLRVAPRRPPADWGAISAVLENQHCPYDRAKAGLALAVLWLADRNASEQPDARAA